VKREVHIASCVVYARPEAAERIASSIRDARLAEVHAADHRGRIVIVLEGPGDASIVDAMEAIRLLPGVLAVHLVYQHCEEEETLQEAP
jgi:nitrate reductase NapD